MERDGLDISRTREPLPSDYLPYLEDDDSLTEEQRLELLETLFNIMKSFVMMGYGMEPVDKLVAAFQEAHENNVDLIESRDEIKSGNEEDDNE
ncbi:MAG: hypothetical protein Pars2KO_13400 [Parasphingorhabdus sp.]